MAKKLYGVIPPLVTPLNQDGSLDKEGLKKLINYCIDGGVHGIFLMGSCGEGSLFTSRFRRELGEEAVKIIDGRVPLLMGVLENTTSKVIDAIQDLEGIAIDYYVVVAPYYLPATQEMILNHFQKIVEATGKQILVYNIPPFTNSVIEPETMSQLCKLPGVVGCKDTNSDWPTVQRELYNSKREGFVMLNGDEELSGIGMLMGTDGCVPGTANAYPRFFVDLYEAAKAGDIAKVYELTDRLDQFKAVMRTDMHWIPRLKYLAARKGLIQEYTADPLPQLTQEQKDELEKILSQVDQCLY